MSVHPSSICLGLLLVGLSQSAVSAQLVADFTATPTSGSNALIVHFSDLSSGDTIIKRSWNFGDGSSGNGTNPDHIYNTPGTFTVSLTAYGSTGAFDTETKSGYVVVEPAQLDVGFLATPTKGIGSLTVTFFNITSSGTAVDAWLWRFGDGFTSTEKDPFHRYDSPGQYTVSLAANIGGQQGVETKIGLIDVGAAFVGPNDISLKTSQVVGLATGDIDRDGDADVAVARIQPGRLEWFENIDGAGTYGPSIDVSPGVTFVSPSGLFLDDVNGDAWPDLGLIDSRRLTWYLGAASPYAEEITIIEDAGANFSDMAVADIDGDGDRDIVSADRNGGQIAWYPNTDGTGSFGPPSVIANNVNNPIVVVPADFDGDGDVDVACLASFPSQVVWFANLGAGTFGPQQVLPPILSPGDMAAADLDGDGDPDLLVVGNSGLQRFMNEGGTFTEALVAGSMSWETVAPGDVDRDGDVDLLAGGSGVGWFDNVDGLGDLHPGPDPLDGELARNWTEVSLADVDRDGDLDLVATTRILDRIAWWENVLAPSPWTTLGGGAYGQAGVPSLAAHGPLHPGAPLTLSVSDAPASTLLLAWLSFTSTPIGILGGTLHANPPTTQLLRATDEAGKWSQSLTWPVSVPSGLTFWLQFIVQDGSAPAGITLTDGLTATTP